MDKVETEKSDSKRTRWQHRIQTWSESGLSQKSYCQANGIALATFSYWRRKLKDAQPERAKFYPILVPPGEPFTSEDEKGKPLRLVLGEQRFVVEIEESFSPALLQKLVTTLEQL